MATPPSGSHTNRRPVGFWAARPPWLRGPDIPSFHSAAWLPIVRDGKALRRAPAGLGGAIVRKISEAPAPAESFALDDAVACQPLFFPAKAGIWIVHASGRSGAQHWDAVFWARRQRAAWEVASYDFKSADVHRLNTEAPLVLDGQYLSYLRYFMHIVRADLGTFRLVDQPDRVPRHWPFSPEAIARRVLPRKDASRADPTHQEALAPPTFDGIDSSGRLRYRVHLLYGGYLFVAEFALAQSGLVEMVSDRPFREAGSLRE